MSYYYERRNFDGYKDPRREYIPKRRYRKVKKIEVKQGKIQKKRRFRNRR